MSVNYERKLLTALCRERVSQRMPAGFEQIPINATDDISRVTTHRFTNTEDTEIGDSSPATVATIEIV